MRRFFHFLFLLFLGALPTSQLIAAPTIFQGPQRQGPNRDGVVKGQWGVEQTMLYEDGIFKSWYHGAPDSGGDYWNNPVIRYATSPDGKNWTDQGTCVGNTPYYRACPYVYHLPSATAAGEPAGYYMPVGRNGQFGFDLFYSVTGLPGSWTQLNNGNLIIGLGPAGSWDEYRSGNICIWYEANQWQVTYEAADVPPGISGHGSQWFSWRVGRAYGPSLTTLTKYPGNPVLTNTTFPYGAENATGGAEVHKVGSTYYCIIHETDPQSFHSLTPTSCSLYKSTDLNNWTRMGWLSRIWVNKTAAAQVADGSLLSVNGKTYLWYEDQPDQSSLLPSLSLMTWDMPFEELVNHPEMLDDTQVDGWTFESGYAEVPSSGAFSTTYFRKLSAPISPHCVGAAADASHQLKVRKAIGTVESQFAFSARAEQTNKRFIPLRIDADAANTILGGAFFDSDGTIKYYNGAAIATAQTYAAATNYKFVYDFTPTGYSLTINDTLISSNIPYASSYVIPAYYKIEQSAGATGYVGTVMVPPVWSGGGSDGNWSTAANWNALPTDGDVITFSGSVGQSNTNDSLTAVGSITLANGGFTISGNPVSIGNSITSSGDNAWNLDSTPAADFSLASNTGTLTLGGSLTASNFQLTKTGSGGVSFRNSNAIVSQLNLSVGSITVDGASLKTTNTTGGWGLWMQNSAAVLNVTNGGTLDVNTALQIQQGTVNMTSGSLSVTTSPISELYVGNGSGAAVLNITGGSVASRVMSFGGNGSSGTLNLTGGVLAWTGNPYKGSGTASLKMGGGTLRANGGFTVPSSLPFSLSGTNGALTLDSQSNSITLANVLSGSGGLIKIGSGTATLTAAPTYTGTTTVSAGSLDVVGTIASFASPSIVNNARMRLATSGGASGVLSYSNAISGNGTFSIDTTGSNGARLQLSGTALSNNCNWSLVNEGTLWLNGAAGTYGTAMNIDIAAGTGPGAYLTLNGSANAVFNIGTLSGAGKVTNNSGNAQTLVAGNGDGSAAFSGVMSGNTTLAKAGTGTLTVSGSNTYTGSTIIANGSLNAGNIVVSGGSSSLGNSSSSVTLGSAVTRGTLVYTGTTATYIRGFTIGGAGGGCLNVTTPTQMLTLTTGNVTGTGLFTIGGAGNISVTSNLIHSGGVTKNGSGVLTISGSGNTYVGDTTVNDGTLVLATGGILKFSPTMNGVSNKVTGTGAAALNGTFNIDLSNASTTPGNTWTLVDVASRTYNGTFNIPGFTRSSGVWTKVVGGNTWSFGETTGVLSFGSSNSYLIWSAAHAGGGTPDQDFSHSGIPNGVRYFMGQSDPPFPASPAMSQGKITWPKDPNAIASYVIQTSTNLIDWTTVTAGVADHGNSVEYSAPAGDPKRFARIKVTVP